jgi:hypothetical protein
MAITKNSGRQWPLVGEVSFAFSAIPTTATAYEAMDLPNGAKVVGGGLTIDTAWDSTTNTLSVGDAGLATRYLTTKDLKSTAGTYFPFVIATDGSADVNVTYAFTGGAATVGAATLTVEYVIDGKANEVQPTRDAV